MLESEKCSVDNTLKTPPLIEVTQPSAQKSVKLNTATQILIGVGISFAVWVLGILLSGELPVVVDYIPFGAFAGSGLFLIYPLIVAVVFVFASVKCAHKGYRAVLLSFLISFLVPILCSVLFWKIESLNFTLPSFMFYVCFPLGVPALSIDVSLFSWFEEYEVKLILLKLAYYTPVIISIIASLLIYEKKKVKNN